MLSRSQIVQGLSDPYFAAKQLNRRFSKYVVSRFRPPCDFFTEDWDNLVILDACRYDIFTEYEFTDTTLEYRWSGGSSSREFLQHNVHGKTLDDVVWVTANPWVTHYNDSIFRVVDAWDSCWDSEHKTVLPEDLTELATDIANEHPDKRLVVQFMQPHYPFIGSTGQSELPHHGTFEGGGLVDDSTDAPSIWELLADGFVSRDTVWRAYKENLDLAIPHAERLARELDGKSVITSDHGNAFGSFSYPFPVRIYGHPQEFRTKDLTKVPWLVFESSDRRDIVSGAIEEYTGDIDEGVVKDRLQHLGYHE